MFLALLTASLLASAEPAAQAAPEPAAAPAPAAAAPPPVQDQKPEARRVKMVCRAETTTGTRFTKRICMPQDEFERRARVSQETMVEMQRTLNTTFSKGN